MKHTFAKRTAACMALVLALVMCLSLSVFAAEAPCQTATVHGWYRHPVTGVIEDSGGEPSFALGQSMVDSLVTPDGLMEEGADGNYYLSVRFKLMDNVSEVNLTAQKPGDAQWAPAAYESTGKGDDQEDFRIAIPSKNAVIRAECFVEAMGRSVVFYMTADNFTSGNAAGFARMDENHTIAAAPAEKSGTGTTGMVTGGSGTAAKPAAEPGTDAITTATNDGERNVIISARVWVMFFVLVFCAQLLACLVFSLIRKPLMGLFHSSGSQSRPRQRRDDDDDDFDLSGFDWVDDDE